MPGFWEQIFGSSRKTIWRQLSQEINAQYIEKGAGSKDRVELKSGNWVITMDMFTRGSGESETTYTRIRAPYLNRDGFRFRIYRKGFFSNIAKELFGMEDIEVGDPYFDEAFIIKGNSETQVRTLFANEGIKRLCQAQPTLLLHVVDDEGWFGKHFPEGVDELYFEARGAIKDLPRLRGLFELFTEILQQLHAIGSAYDADPFAPFTIPLQDTLLRASQEPSTDKSHLLRPSQEAHENPDTLLRPSSKDVEKA